MPMAKVRVGDKKEGSGGVGSRQVSGTYDKSVTLQSADMNFNDDSKRQTIDANAMGSPNGTPTNANNSKAKERMLEKSKSFN